MLTIVVQDEVYDEEKNVFIQTNAVRLEFEHSLVSLSKWESKYQVPFLADTEKTSEQILDYVGFMLIDAESFEHELGRLTQEDFSRIQEYINSPQSATTFGAMPRKGGPSEVITAELIYYWMIAFTIPFECQTWHLNRLFSLIRICNQKNSKPKKMSAREIAERNRELNKKRKEELGTSG